MASEHTRPRDKDIAPDRDRIGRFTFLGIYILSIIMMATNGLTWLGKQFFPDYELVESISWFTGLGIAVGILIYSIEKWFLIRNNTTGLFVTQDVLATLLDGDKDPNIAYGPGVHVCFPWERRLGENNISLREAANNFDFTIQCKDGIVKGKGSFRLRPDQRNPVTFLGSISSAADDITDLIIGAIAAKLEKKNVQEALRSYKLLNVYLEREFADKDTEIEERCGVKISDVTIRELLPSEDTQKTISAIGEAQAIARGTEIILGMTADEIRAEIEAGRMTQADVNLARDRFLSISGNLEGMEIKRNEFDVSLHGLDPEAAKAITAILNSREGQAVIARYAGSKKKKKGKRK